MLHLKIKLMLIISDDRAHLRYTNKKIKPKESTLAKVKDDPIYKMEREFYDFAVNEFEYLWKRIHTDDGDNFIDKQYHFEKIKP